VVALIASASVSVPAPAHNRLVTSYSQTPGLRRLGVLLSVLIPLFTSPVYANDCLPQGRLETVRVERAVDGDTLALTDRRRVRLIGFNAPEKAGKGRPAEPLANAAQVALANLVVSKTIYLQLGEEPYDRYGRMLAHAFLTAKGHSVEAKMLSEGWGFQVVVAPNKAHASCFAEAEINARSAKRGVWANAHYRPVPAASIDGKKLGFLRVHGTVQSASLTKAALWLSLEGEVVLRIDRKDLAMSGWPVSNTANPDQWKGKALTVRGWLKDRYANKAAPKNRQRYVMELNHPAMIER
jgi:endonuclease YncB( thermonuclease family)